MIKNIVISGYYGFDNFGDEAVLRTLINEIRNNTPDAGITVITSNPTKTAKVYNVNTVYTYDLTAIFKVIWKADLFISGGGSVLQDVTSLKSLFYYLFLIFIAEFLDKKVAIIAQGIGPINTFIGRIFTKNTLKKVHLITVRDKKSYKLLDEWGIKSYLTADLIWILGYKAYDRKEKVKLSVGVQLRHWKKMDDKKIKSLIKSLKTSFDLAETEFNVIALQPKEDLEICKKFHAAFKKESPDVNINLICLNDIDENINEIRNLDYLIAMRFHAGLIAIREKIPALMLSYDPKVENLCTDANVSYINIDQINEDILCREIKNLQQNSFILKEEMGKFSYKIAAISRQNIDLLSTILK
ncbi:MAG: polysaccharide pyruvyl transferase CsaB [Candidatus Gastranaerophilaceae bacterium]|jgi:polysaccharide pyruvyl transferase CsaB